MVNRHGGFPARGIISPIPPLAIPQAACPRARFAPQTRNLVEFAGILLFAAESALPRRGRCNACGELRNMLLSCIQEWKLQAE